MLFCPRLQGKVVDDAELVAVGIQPHPAAFLTPQACNGNCHARQSVHPFMDKVASDSWVGEAVARAMEEWSQAAGPWQSTAPVYSVTDQKLREKAYDRALRD